MFKEWLGKVTSFIFIGSYFSLILHFLVVLLFSQNAEKFSREKKQRKEYVNLVFKKRLSLLKKDEKLISPENKRVLESNQKKTKAPEKADFLGVNDHKATKETKVDITTPRPKAADVGGLREKAKTRTNQDKTSDFDEAKKTKESLKVEKKFKRQIKNKLSYKDLLRLTSKVLSEEGTQKGFMDYLDNSIESGDAIDINTTSYRYVGYFTNLRKEIELVWNYPLQAIRRGLKGSVRLKFIIQADGRVSKLSLLESSGYKILDDSILEAIRLASPFSPLPEGFKKEQLEIKGNFVYNLHY